MKKNIDLKLESRDLETVHSKVCRVLREAILRGDFEPGERLVQEELANSLGVSRMPVREALRKLEIEGLITIEPHRGAIVKSISVDDIEEIYQLRSKFEKIAVEESVKRMDTSSINELERLVSLMEQADQIENFVQLNIEFHRVLMSNCPWKRLLFFIETLWNGFPQHTPHMITGQTEQSNKEHYAILRAVKSQDANKAADLVSEHINRTRKALVGSIHGDA
ncbi:GntR family transcriptional regulator [Aneurinibacillus sp. Ricciae_BoGa-3]|uniref:GntR family transcriptional regulator n=1 Tax=Aneurinibacillus sp. Ricciae_BoGa-3 TaxID=3022697 RepID=UPI0023416433|nr:GntR family transcriptional regulator [Aneurinibacillus sp. Ricciae_BoGa-3]WCK56347.1 GntR family transcriptional regulator [Aneurinibacillus sp. Ricciae_BoGa-3]